MHTKQINDEKVNMREHSTHSVHIQYSTHWLELTLKSEKILIMYTLCIVYVSRKIAKCVLFIELPAAYRSYQNTGI